MASPSEVTSPWLIRVLIKVTSFVSLDWADSFLEVTGRLGRSISNSVVTSFSSSRSRESSSSM